MKFLQQNYVKYALIMCAAVVACLFYMEVSGQNQSFEKSPLVSIFIFATPVLIWYLGLKAKKKQLKGKMTFKQGVVEGFKISLTYGIISPLIFLFYYLFVNPPILTYVAKAYGLNDAVDHKTVIHVDLLVTFFTAVIGGTILSAIISFFLKSKNK